MEGFPRGFSVAEVPRPPTQSQRCQIPDTGKELKFKSVSLSLTSVLVNANMATESLPTSPLPDCKPVPETPKPIFLSYGPRKVPATWLQANEEQPTSLVQTSAYRT